LTGIHDFDGRRSFTALQMLKERGQLGLRVVKQIQVRHLGEAVGLGLRSGFGDDWLRLGNIKVFLDGALGPRTASMIEPYEGQLNVVASMQPIHATSDMRMADRYWGKRSALAYAWRTQLEAGAVLAFGSDCPVESFNPFWGLHAAVTRRRADGAPGPAGWYPE